MPVGSHGAHRVREDFNPTRNDLVTKIKRYTADLIDLCIEQQHRYPNADPEEFRWWALAQTAYEEAAMWAVKAATADNKGDQDAAA